MSRPDSISVSVFVSIFVELYKTETSSLVYSECQMDHIWVFCNIYPTGHILAEISSWDSLRVWKYSQTHLKICTASKSARSRPPPYLVSQKNWFSSIKFTDVRTWPGRAGTHGQFLTCVGQRNSLCFLFWSPPKSLNQLCEGTIGCHCFTEANIMLLRFHHLCRYIWKAQKAMFRVIDP